MSSLIVLLPSSDVLAPGGCESGWEATPMPFALLGRHDEILRCGQAHFEALPKAGATVLVVAARDTLLLHAKLPPVTGAKLQRVLPNVVEEYLIQDAQRCHIAVGPAASSEAQCLAVIDRDWFAAIVERFVQAGHRRLRAVPLIHCIPRPDAAPSAPLSLPPDVVPAAGTSAHDAMHAIARESVPLEPTVIDDAAEAIDTELAPILSSVLIVRGTRIDAAPVSTESDSGAWVELALRQGTLGFGMSVNAAQLDATLIELAQRGPVEIYSLEIEATAEPGIGSGIQPSQRAQPGLGLNPDRGPHREPGGIAARWAGELRPAANAGLTIRGLPLATVVREALACRFNLCQFEFAGAGRSRPGAGGLKPWRVALAFVAASLLVSIMALNLQWWQLRQRRDGLNQQMTQLVLAAFPGTTVILDPHQQMAAELARLRDLTGGLRSDDYLAQAAALAHALGPLPSASITELNYSGGALEVTFKADTEIDEDGFKRRLAANGLSAHEDNGKWTLKPALSGMR